MNSLYPKVQFYISNFDGIKKKLEDTRLEISEFILGYRSTFDEGSLREFYMFLRENKSGICMGDGEFAWSLQTYLRLKASGFPCELVGNMPSGGIILAHYNSLNFNLKPKANQLLIYLKADKPIRPYAQMSVVQNSNELRALKNSCYIPHWPVPGLLPRNPNRGIRFERIGYFGVGGSLAEELRGDVWKSDLEDLGLTWKFKTLSEWHDYGDIDAVVAVRSFNRSVGQQWNKDQGAWKPPSKLFNSWIAGVPAILGPEPAYQDQRKGDFDYIEVRSYKETIDALKHLRDDTGLRLSMMNNARLRSQEIQIEQVLKAWKKFITDTAVPAYFDWCSTSGARRRFFIIKKYARIKSKALQNRLNNSE